MKNKSIKTAIGKLAFYIPAFAAVMGIICAVVLLCCGDTRSASLTALNSVLWAIIQSQASSARLSDRLLDAYRETVARHVKSADDMRLEMQQLIKQKKVFLDTINQLEKRDDRQRRLICELNRTDHDICAAKAEADSLRVQLALRDENYADLLRNCNRLQAHLNKLERTLPTDVHS